MTAVANMVRLARAGAWGLGRKTDELVITAASATSSTVSGSGLIAKSRVLEALEAMNTSDVPNDGQRYALVTPHQQFARFTPFQSADYPQLTYCPATRFSLHSHS